MHDLQVQRGIPQMGEAMQTQAQTLPDDSGAHNARQLETTRALQQLLIAKRLAEDDGANTAAAKTVRFGTYDHQTTAEDDGDTEWANSDLPMPPVKRARTEIPCSTLFRPCSGSDCEDPARDNTSAGHGLAIRVPGVSSNTPEWRTPGPQVEILAPKPSSDLDHSLPGEGGREVGRSIGLSGHSLPGPAVLANKSRRIPRPNADTFSEELSQYDVRGSSCNGVGSRKQASETEIDRDLPSEVPEPVC